MPSEFTAVSLHFARLDKYNAQKRKTHTTVDPRRTELHHCDYKSDPTKNGNERFKNGICCKTKQCVLKYTAADVLVLRKALLLRAPYSTDRRAFLSFRYVARQGYQARGSGVYSADSPTCCRLNAYAAPSKTALPLHSVDKIEVCASFFNWAFSVSNDQTRCGLANRLVYKKRRRSAGSTKRWRVEHWLLELSSFYQIQPDNDMVLLPFANKQSVYQMFETEQKGDKELISSSYFFKVWRESLQTKHIRLRKHLRFTKCDICVELRERKSRTMDANLLAQVRQEEYEHFEFIKAERGSYYGRRSFAVSRPDKALSIIIDGADWYNYAVPYFATTTHESSKLYRAALYLMGVISHGRSTKCFIVPGIFKQGTNVVLDVLVRTLQDMKDDGEILPETLYLQLDNTAKQNKNKYLIGFLGYLVHYNVFKDVIVSFLPVGHTHEDIDQLFSRLVTALMCRDAKSVTELMAIIRQSYTDSMGRPTKTEQVHAPANISDWIAPYLAEFEGISRYRQFRIKRRTPNGSVIVRCRDVTTGKHNWSGIEKKTDYTVIFKEEPPPWYVTLFTSYNV